MACEIRELKKPLKFDDGSVAEFEMRFIDRTDIPTIYVIVNEEEQTFDFGYQAAEGLFVSVPEEFYDTCIEEFLAWSEENDYGVWFEIKD